MVFQLPLDEVVDDRLLSLNSAVLSTHTPRLKIRAAIDNRPMA
jgi:hypothetical protein